MKKLAWLLLASLLLCSCSSAALSPDADGVSPPQAADYADGDLAYTVTVSDENRSVSLDVTRENGVSRCVVTSPEELAGIALTADTDGVHVSFGDGGEIVLSAEAAAGLLAVLNTVSHAPAGSELTGDGCFRFDSEGWEVCLFLGENGYPAEASLTREGCVRHVKFAVNGVPASENR